MRKTKTTKKRFSEMSLDELREATKEFDRPSEDGYGFKPLNASHRATWNRVKRGPGRPKVGQGASNVLVSIERGLLKQADELAKQRNMSRSALVSAGLRALLSERIDRRDAVARRRKSA
jgi:hypothetical protein